MDNPKDKETLDELISRAIGRENLTFDFDNWKKHHKEEIQQFESKTKHRSIIFTAKTGVWGKVISKNIIKFAAAAMIVAAVFIGIKMFTGRGEMPSKEIAEQKGILDTEVVGETAKAEKSDFDLEFEARQAGKKLDSELKNIKQMFAARDVAGLVAMLEEGKRESKIAAANYLAEIGDLSAIEPLEKLSRQWQGDSEDNLFSIAVSKIKSRLDQRKEKEGLLVSKDEKSSSDTVTDANSKSSYFSYKMQKYSLREEPMRVKPRTLDNPNPAPEEAIVLNWPIQYWSSHWASELNTSSVALEQHDIFTRFIVNEPNRYKIWARYFDIPIYADLYPIIVMKYRAWNINCSNRYLLYLDDDSGPDYGGLLPVLQWDLIADGKEQILTYDLREMKTFGDLIGMAVGVYSDSGGPAQFDLLDLRFETALENDPIEKIGEDSELIVTVLDGQDQPIKGATVTVDAERRNWARSAITDSVGQAKITPYATVTYKHMIRVTKKGMMPVEIRDLPDKSEPIIAILEPATFYRGKVHDENGQPIEGVTINISSGYVAPRGLLTRTDAEILSDSHGRWRSPPMPKSVELVRISLAHPDYTSGPSYAAAYELPLDSLTTGELVLAIKQQRTTITGTVVDENGQALENASIVAASNLKNTVVSDSNGYFKIKAVKRGDRLLIIHDCWAPNIVKTIPESEYIEIVMQPGHNINIKVVDPNGQPLPDTELRLISWRGFKRTILKLRTNADGEVMSSSVPDEPLVFMIYKKNFMLTTETLIPQQDTHIITLVPLDPDSKYEKIEDPNDSRPPDYDPFEIFRKRR